MDLDTILEEITTRVVTNKSRSHSRADHIRVTAAVLNDPEHAFTLIEDRAGKPVEREVTPAAEHRKQLKYIVGQFGVDTKELSRLDTMPLTKSYSESLIDVSAAANSAYLSTGRKLALPTFVNDGARMCIEYKKTDEKKSVIRKIEAGGSVETDQMSVTKPHQKLVAHSKPFSWLKSREPR